MTKRVSCVVAFVGILGLLHIPVANQTIMIYITEENMWEGRFTEPFEILYVRCENGDMYGFSSHQESTVPIWAGQLNDYLKKRGHELEEVLEMVHNHFGYPFMSRGNKKFLNDARRLGFKGTFSMIDTASGRMVCIRNDGEVVRYRK